MRRITSKKEYDEFRTEFQKFKVIFGLVDYDIGYTWGETEDGDYANISTDPPNRVADLYFCKEIPKGADMDLQIAKDAGKHEAIHLLLARARHLALRRNLTVEEWTEEEEHIVRVLEKIILV